MHAINSARDRLTAESTALVLVLGGLGHMGLQILSATTGVRIIAADTDPEKVAYASKHGADLAIPSDADTAARVLDETDGRGRGVRLRRRPTHRRHRHADASPSAARCDSSVSAAAVSTTSPDLAAACPGVSTSSGPTAARARTWGRCWPWPAPAGSRCRPSGATSATRRVFADLDSGAVQGRIVLVP